MGMYGSPELNQKEELKKGMNLWKKINWLNKPSKHLRV